MKATFLLGACLSASLILAASAAESNLRSDDILTLVGGEDMATLAESGRLEAQIVRQPGLAGIKVRSLACEGDTVFEQHRQLNYPTWEQQLEKIGATVVIVQFGQMEALRAGSSPEEFAQNCGALLKRLAGGKRQLVILSPTPFEEPAPPLPDRTSQNAAIEAQLPRMHVLADKLGAAFVDLYRTMPEGGGLTRDGVHLNERGLKAVAREIVKQLGLNVVPQDDPVLLGLLAEKNRLWFNYHRPQNWAFLHGDRTEQLFSRDYRDTSVRRLVLEMEEYVPLIETKEREIIAHLKGVQAEKN